MAAIRVRRSVSAGFTRRATSPDGTAPPLGASQCENRQVRAPWTDRISVLPSHHANDLADVPQIVRHPGGQMLAHGDDAELGMSAVPAQVRISERELIQTSQTVLSQSLERVEELSERQTLRRFEHRLAIEDRKRHRVSIFEDVFDAWHPI